MNQLMSQILVYAQYVHQNEVEEFLICEPLEEPKKPVEIMAMVNKIFYSNSL
jgi:hypothetical protein